MTRIIILISKTLYTGGGYGYRGGGDSGGRYGGGDWGDA